MNILGTLGSQINLFLWSIALYVGILAILPMFMDDYSKKKKRKNLEEVIEKSFNEKLILDINQLEILLKNYNLTSQDLHILLRSLFTSAVKNNSLEFLSYIQKLYEYTERQAPFEGLPSDVKLHLERIKQELGEANKNLMDPLATQLQDLNISNKRKNKVMWALTLASFIVGLVGMVMAFVPYVEKTSPSINSKNLNIKKDVSELSLSDDKKNEMIKYYHGIDVSEE